MYIMIDPLSFLIGATRTEHRNAVPKIGKELRYRSRHSNFELVISFINGERYMEYLYIDIG